MQRGTSVLKEVTFAWSVAELHHCHHHRPRCYRNQDGGDSGAIQLLQRCMQTWVYVLIILALSQQSCWLVLGTPEDHFSNGYKEPLDSFLAHSVDEGNNAGSSAEMVSAWGPQQLEVVQGAPTTFNLGLMDYNAIGDRPNRYLIANLYCIST